MNVVVLLRVIDDPELAAGVTGSTLRIDDPSLVALGMALDLVRRSPGARLTAVAAGPGEWDAALREAVALGADDVARAWSDEFAPLDIPASAAALAAAIPRDTSLVIAGGPAGDHGSGVLPGAVAEALTLPLLAEVTAIETGPDGLVAQTRGDGGRRRRFALPARAVLVTARMPTPGLVPPLARRLAARKRPVAAILPGETGLLSGASERTAILEYGPARPLTRHLLKPSASANPADRLRQLMSGGMSGRAGKTLDSGGGSGMAGQLAEILVREGYLA
ncbi:MAG: hypothetical protein KJ053_05995 [Dehalococcoidia bacterium]|nr:hypothetical protein [Dehalococcoidia bacterium]